VRCIQVPEARFGMIFFITELTPRKDSWRRPSYFTKKSVQSRSFMSRLIPVEGMVLAPGQTHIGILQELTEGRSRRTPRSTLSCDQD